jgi:Uma2 family endonuclease
LTHNLGELFHAPYDVHFDDKNVVQPDLLYVSIARKAIVEDFIKGAPDFVVEILSASNSKAEMEAKIETYGKYDVLEYWIVKPLAESVEVYHNKEHRMQLVADFGMDDTIKSVAIEGFELDVKLIFT